MKKFILCLFALSFSLYSYVDKQNELTGLQIAIPQISKEIKAIREKNTQLQYEIDQFESPENLMVIARRNDFAHLKFPSFPEIVTLKEGIALQSSDDRAHLASGAKSKASLAAINSTLYNF